ncbi:ATP-dependent DNA helicase srs2 [Marasmius crinis-equi]|uniref:DNA 3'-5' helicase n=1 Tax=Marasmius crinis-equi TaxID=585013 RepID=A0ABR3FI14_9AGAR
MSFLNMLNPAQLTAVKHQPEVPLQILAGPGSGKTKVLTSRIAHLILEHKIPPAAICAVTFTNKAANEMKERLTKLIGKPKMVQVKMGTFHALCALFLRKYAKEVGLVDNFTVCDADESKKIINALLKDLKDELESKDITLKDGMVQSIISKAKARSQSVKEFREEVEDRLRINVHQSSFRSMTDDIDLIVADIYEEYEKTLRRNNSLDFDDLLVYGLRLFANHKKAVKWCKHVLVDEFQDTNTTQYELMRAIALVRCVTIVGDPDQSIYGWRSAEVGNLAKMRKDFPGTHQIFLEQNYRSTSSILKASIAIVEQDKSRIKKTLHASHPAGTTPVLREFETEQLEAAGIASEIKRLIAYTGSMLGYGDFVVLLRFNALSRSIESALQKEGIPNRVLKGHKFFERLEVKDLLAYLQLVDNPQFIPAFTRIINVPARGIGDKTLKELLSRGEKEKLSPLQIVEKIVDGRTPDIKPPVKRKLGSFVSAIRTIRKLATEGSSPAVLIRKLYDVIEYEDHLKKTQPDWESRWENVQELITFASDVDADIKVDHDPEDEQNTDTPLRLFLQASMLSSEGDNESSEEDKKKVTISTCHAAKGLEWPVVIIPAIEEGTFPFYRSDDMEEERRLLYVACTRAQSLLYMSHASTRKVGGDVKPRDLSTFVESVTEINPSLFTERLPVISRAEREVIARVLDRPDATEEEVRKSVDEYTMKTARRQVASVDWNPLPEGVVPDANFMSSSTLLASYPCQNDTEWRREEHSTATDDAHIVNAERCTQGRSGRLAKKKVGGFSRPVAALNIQQRQQSTSFPISSSVPSKKGSNVTIDVAFPSHGRAVPYSRSTTPKTYSNKQDLTLKPALPPVTHDQNVSFMPASRPVTEPYSNTALGHPPRTVSNNQNLTPKPAPPSVPKLVSNDQHVSFEPVSRPMPIPNALPKAVAARKPNHAPLQTTSNLIAPATYSDGLPHPQPPSLSNADPVASASPPQSSGPNKVPSGQIIGVKRRLGMGRVMGGYQNKKFKPPGS